MPINDPRKSHQVVHWAVEMLKDPTRRVRQRAAYELGRWVADVPVKSVEDALRKETNERARRVLERLLEKVKEQQSS